MKKYYVYDKITEARILEEREHEAECLTIAKYIQCEPIEVHEFLEKHEWSFLSLYYYASRHGKFPDTT